MKLHPLLGDPNSDYINANYIDVSGDVAVVPSGWGLVSHGAVGVCALQGAEPGWALTSLVYVRQKFLLVSVPVPRSCISPFSSAPLLPHPLFCARCSCHGPRIIAYPGYRMQKLEGTQGRAGGSPWAQGAAVLEFGVPRYSSASIWAELSPQNDIPVPPAMPSPGETRVSGLWWRLC